MMNNFSALRAIGKFFLFSFIISSFYSCGKEKSETTAPAKPSQTAMTEQAPSRTDQAEEIDTTQVLDNAIPAVVYSQRYDGTVPY